MLFGMGLLCLIHSFAPGVAAVEYRLATFAADVTVPLGHRSMGIIPIKTQRIADPLEAIGFVLLGPDAPLVYVAVDWCEIRNGAYDQWRDALASAAGTTRERVLVSALHQHDAPIPDAGAGALLQKVGLAGELYDVAFHQVAVKRVAEALQASLPQAQPVTHVGVGRSEVQQVASNRRIEHPDGRITFGRGSRSASDPVLAAAPTGEIDSELKTLSFWNGEKCLVALHVYATHPMSYYGQGVVSADFVGLARRKMQALHPQVRQLYASGCSGDVTAGKFNDGSEVARQQLIDRMFQAMQAAFATTVRSPLTQVEFRNTALHLPYYDHHDLKPERLRQQLENPDLRVEDRIWAAMGLSSWQRVQAGQAIDFPCVDFGVAQLVLFPGEAFVGYQLMAQQQRPDSTVFSIGYGESWPGYIPTNAGFADGFHDNWLWVGPGSEQQIRAALEVVLPASGE